MKAAVAITLLLCAPQAVEVRDASGGAEPARTFALAEGLAEVERLCREQEYAAASAVTEGLLAPTGFLRWRRRIESEGSRLIAPLLAACDPALDWLGWNGLSEDLQAEVHYAAGLVGLESEDRERAAGGFEAARASAGSGELRLQATYNLGLTALLEGEEWRARMLEIEGRMPGLIGPTLEQGGAQVDPQTSARAAYLRARELLVERLRQDWRDGRTRANVELVQRRLKWLDQLEQERRQQQDGAQKPPEDRQGDPQQDGSEPRDQQDPQDPSQDPQNPERDPNEAQPGENDEQDPQAGETPQQENPDQRESDQEPPPGEGEAQEVYLTREEEQRLFDRLRAHEQEGEQVEARLYQTHRRRVDRDW